jgi:hypothetical protein
MKRIFRTTAKYWAQEDGAGLVVSIIWIVGSLLLGWMLFAGIGALILLIGLRGVYLRLLSRLEIDGEGITCIEKSSQISIKWSRILFIQLLKSYRRPMRVLRVVVSEATVQPVAAPGQVTGAGVGNWLQAEILIDHFDHKEIWRLVQSYAPPDAFEEDAYRKAPGYSLWLYQAKQTISEARTPLKVSMSGFVRIFAWGLMLIMAACVVILSYSFLGVVISILFFLLGLWSVISTGKIEVDHETITHDTPIGCYRISWDEIAHIETDVYGSMVFYGDDKHLAIYGPGWWSGKDKRSLAEFLFLKIELNKIRIENKRVLFKMARNTRVR